MNERKTRAFVPIDCEKCSFTRGTKEENGIVKCQMCETETLTEEPSMEQLEEWLESDGCRTECGCWVEPDGVCQHGRPSWLLKLGLI